MHIEYITREGKPSPYDGPYQFQYMSDEEVEIYRPIITKEFKDIFDEEGLDNMMKNRVKG